MEGGADVAQSNITQDIEDKAEADHHTSTLNTDDGEQKVFTAAGEAAADVFIPQEGEGEQDLEVPQEEKDLHGLLQELQLETGDLQVPAETPPAGSVHVRRRNRRRKGKKDSHC